MKKVIALVLLAGFLVSVGVGCGGSTATTGTTKSTTTTTTTGAEKK